MHCLLKANSKPLSRGCVDILYTAQGLKKRVCKMCNFQVPSFAKDQVLQEKIQTFIFNLQSAHPHFSTFCHRPCCTMLVPPLLGCSWVQNVVSLFLHRKSYHDELLPIERLLTLRRPPVETFCRDLFLGYYTITFSRNLLFHKIILPVSSWDLPSQTSPEIYC